MVESPELRAGLARAELIRVCGEETMAALAAREGGAALLQSLLADTPWTESFLGSGKQPGVRIELAVNDQHGRWHLPVATIRRAA